MPQAALDFYPWKWSKLSADNEPHKFSPSLTLTHVTLLLFLNGLNPVKQIGDTGTERFSMKYEQ